ncbi:MAG: glycosyltransferase N-terminal domain-containing protein [Elusimicrobiota bacterium]
MLRTIVLVLETLLAPFAALGVLLSFAFSRRRGLLSSLFDELPERLGGLSGEAKTKLAQREIYWLHAASAGEIAGLAPLIEALASRPDAPALFVTTMTAAGRDAARKNPRITWAQLAPLDAWPCVARLLSSLRAERLVLSETELWPTLLILSSRAGLRPMLINARLTSLSLGRLRLVRGLLKPALDSLAQVGVQSEPEAARFRALGMRAERVQVTGNCKYDQVAVPAADAEVYARLGRLGWGESPIFVAGSTHPVEEDAVLAGFLQARTRLPSLKLVLAPRHPERSAEAWRSLVDASLHCARWSRLGPGANIPADTEAVLVDSLGVLAALYTRAAVAFVGGTLVPVGGHNLLEPALAGVPVLFGPYTSHIELPATILEESRGGFRVRDASQFADRLVELAGSPKKSREAGARARQAAEALRGATARTLALLSGAK